MVDVAVSEGLAEGERLLAFTEWAAAASAFESVLAINDEPAGHDGLGRALWWLRDIDGAIATDRTWQGREPSSDILRKFWARDLRRFTGGATPYCSHGHRTELPA